MNIFFVILGGLSALLGLLTLVAALRGRVGESRKSTAQLIAGMMANVAEWERDVIGQRTRDAYQLTPAGEELKVVMVAMQQWGEAHVPQMQGPRVLPLTVDTGERVRAALVDPPGRIVPDTDVAFIRTDAAEAASL